MSEPFPEKFRRDVVVVVHEHEGPRSQIARDFGISDTTLHNWLRRVDAGVHPVSSPPSRRS